QRLAEDLLAWVVNTVAAQVPAVGADVGCSAGSAGEVLAAAVGALGVDGAEAWGGEGGEDGGVGGDCGRDAFAADQAGADELVGVAPVGGRAVGAGGGAAVAAVLVDDAVGHVAGV